MDNGLFGEHHLHDSLGLYVIAIHKRSNRGSEPNDSFWCLGLEKERYSRAIRQAA